MRVFAPTGWKVEERANGNRQVRVVAAVPSKRVFHQLLNEAGVIASMYEVNRNAGDTGNEAEVEAASTEPYALFYETGDYTRVYRRVPV